MMIGGTTARVPGRRSRPARPVTRRAAPSAVTRSTRPSTQTARQQVAPRRQRVAQRRRQAARRRQRVPPRPSSPTPTTQRPQLGVSSSRIGPGGCRLAFVRFRPRRRHTGWSTENPAAYIFFVLITRPPKGTDVDVVDLFDRINRGQTDQLDCDRPGPEPGRLLAGTRIGEPS